MASLHHKGLNKILEKVGEEATEVILAAKDAAAGGDRNAVISEVADLWFHSMVMLSHLELDVDDVMRCLGDRFGVSGLDEKAAREDVLQFDVLLWHGITGENYGIGGFSIWHWLILLVIVIMLFGTKRLSTLGSDLAMQ